MPTIFQIRVNDQVLSIAPGTTVSKLLKDLKINAGHVAVERNLEIVSQNEFEVVSLSANDQLEIVTLMGGG